MNFSVQPKTIDYATVKPSTDQAETDYEFEVPFQIDSMKQLKHTNRTAGGCKLPPGGYKYWNRGVVTVLTPEVHPNCTLLFGGDELEVYRIKIEKDCFFHLSDKSLHIRVLGMDKQG